MAELIRWMNVKLAPCISIHGVLVDVYGVGVLIMGESGIGKSEAALELIKRGHRLVTDDVVEIRKVSDDTLVGSAPDITRHFIELRGIGIVDVKSMFGVQSVRETQNIDLVITLEDWSREKEYDRLGLEETYTEFLGNKVVCHNIPIRPGRNLAIIVESAGRGGVPDYRLRRCNWRCGYDAGGSRRGAYRSGNQTDSNRGRLLRPSVGGIIDRLSPEKTACGGRGRSKEPPTADAS